MPPAIGYGAGNGTRPARPCRARRATVDHDSPRRRDRDSSGSTVFTCRHRRPCCPCMWCCHRPESMADRIRNVILPHSTSEQLVEHIAKLSEPEPEAWIFPAPEGGPIRHGVAIGVPEPGAALDVGEEDGRRRLEAPALPGEAPLARHVTDGVWTGYRPAAHPADVAPMPSRPCPFFRDQDTGANPSSRHA